MAQVLELFGPPGVGKTSIARALDGRRVGGRRLVVAQRLTRVPRGPWLGGLLQRDLTPDERRQALAARRKDWSELLALIAGASLGRGQDPLRALHSPGWLAASLELRALADAAPDDVIVVLDEGLVQRAGIVCGADPSDAALTSFLRVIPAPLLHVQLQLEPARLLERLRRRQRVIDRHAGLDDAGLTDSLIDDSGLFDRCASVLAALGKPCHLVETGTALEASAASVVMALERAS